MTTEIETSINEYLYGKILEHDEIEAFLNALTRLAVHELSADGDEVLCRITLLRHQKVGTVASSSEDAQELDVKSSTTTGMGRARPLPVTKAWSRFPISGKAGDGRTTPKPLRGAASVRPWRYRSCWNTGTGLPLTCTRRHQGTSRPTMSSRHRPICPEGVAIARVSRTAGLTQGG